MQLSQMPIVRHGFESLAFTQPSVPMVADGHMSNLIAQDDVENLHGSKVPGSGQSVLHRRGRVQAPSLQGPGHQGHPGRDVEGRFDHHGPQSIVGVEVSIVAIQRVQMNRQQLKMMGLFCGDSQPVDVISRGQIRKTPDSVQSQVDRIEFNVRYGMQQGSSTIAREWAAAWHLCGWHQQRPSGSAR